MNKLELHYRYLRAMRIAKSYMVLPSKVYAKNRGSVQNKVRFNVMNDKRPSFLVWLFTLGVVEAPPLKRPPIINDLYRKTK
jgi:hypothetical protein